MMRTFQLVLLYFFGLQSAQAQWVNIPIAEAARPLNFDTDGDDVYVLTSGGVYKSTNRGDHWNLMEGSRPFCIAGIQLQAEKGVIYVLNSKGELYKTEDQGAHWRTIMRKPYLNPAPGEHISRFFVTGDTVLVGSKFTIYRSTDRGEHWAATVDWFNFGYYRNFAKVGPDLFAIVDWYILKSEDGGVTWKQNFSASYNFGALFALDTVLFAKYAEYARILRSYDRGQHWEVIDSDVLGDFFNTKFQYEDGFAGEGDRLFYYKKSDKSPVTRSHDDGSNWDNPNYFQITFCLKDLLALPDRTLACTWNNGLMKSVNECQTFQTSMDGMYASDVYRIGKSCKNRWWAQTNVGLYFSDDKGLNWAKDSTGMFPPITENRFFKNDSCSYRFSENNGQNWTTIGSNQLSGCFKIVTSEHEAWFFDDYKMYRLEDGKTTPVSFDVPPVPGLKIINLDVASGLLRAAVREPDGKYSIFVSNTNSSNWQKMPSVAANYVVYPDGFICQDEKDIFASFDGRYYVWHIGDSNWQPFYPINASTGDTIQMIQTRFMKSGSGRRWMGGYGQGLFFSNVDDPTHWYPFDPAVPFPSLECIFFDSKQIWVGTFGANIYATDYEAPTPSGHLSDTDFTLYPNPSITTATLRSNRVFSDKMSLKIFNAAGVLVYAEELAPGKQWTPDLTTLHAGLYFWQIKNAAGTVTLKWVKEGR